MGEEADKPQFARAQKQKEYFSTHSVGMIYIKINTVA